MCLYGLSILSPDRGFKFEEFLRSLDDQGAVTGQDAGAQEETHIPVTLQLVQAAFFTQQATQLDSWKQDKNKNITVLFRFPLDQTYQ